MLLSWNPFCTIAFFNLHFIFILFCQPSIMPFFFPASAFVSLIGYLVNFMCHCFTSCLSQFIDLL